MWIPIITILWALGDTATWVNFPMVNFPFSSQETCYKYIDTKKKYNARRSILKWVQYMSLYRTTRGRKHMINWDKIKFEMWNKRFGEGTNFDLDYGKLLIIGLLVYHIFFQG